MTIQINGYCHPHFTDEDAEVNLNMTCQGLPHGCGADLQGHAEAPLSSLSYHEGTVFAKC